MNNNKLITKLINKKNQYVIILTQYIVYIRSDSSE